MIRSIAALGTTILLAVATLATPVLASPDEEAGFVRLINQERTDRGLPALEVYWDLVDDARIHSVVMSDADEIFHSSNLAGVTTGWAVLGENVGVGPGVTILHDAFMNSAGHRENILGDWDSVGVGVTHSDRGYMFVTAVFMKSAEPKPLPAAASPSLEASTEAAAVDPAPVVAPAVVAAATQVPEPVAAPEPVKRLIDELMDGADFPFSLA